MPSRDDAQTAPSEDYVRWVAEYDTMSDADRSAIRSECHRLQRPLISVVMSPCNTTLDLLSNSLTSVRDQLYSSWEMCLPVAAELTSQLSRSTLGPFLHDSRVRKIDVPDDYNCLSATIAAFERAAGDFVGFLFSGDQLSEDALYQVAGGIIAEGNVDLLYTDEDSIDSSGLRQDPRFKPGWDRDLLLASNYVGQFTVFRRTLLGEIGSLRESAGDASYWDLLLRAAAAITDDRVRHLPLVCYHHHKEETSFRPALSPEGTVPDSTVGILSEHLQACGEPPAKFMPAAPGTNYIRVVRPVPEPPPLVSVIIPTRDHVDVLKPCVEGVLSRTDYPCLELLIVDNDSREADTVAFVRTIAEEDPRVRVLRYPGIFNYSAMNNAAAREAQGEVLLLLNNDIEIISPHWLSEMVSHVVRPEVGAVGAKLVYPDGRLQHGGVVLGPGGAVTHIERFVGPMEKGYLNQLSVTRSLSAVTGACMAIRRDVYYEAGGLDDANLLMSCNDIDLCLRLGDLGYKIIWTPFAQLVHHESVSRGNPQHGSVYEQEVREQQYLRATWGKLVDTDDPFHNPNLRFGWNKVSIPIFPPRGRRRWANTLATPRSPIRGLMMLDDKRVEKFVIGSSDKLLHPTNVAQSQTNPETILQGLRTEVVRNNFAERQLRAREAQRTAEARAEACDALVRAADSNARREQAERDCADARVRASEAEALRAQAELRASEAEALRAQAELRASEAEALRAQAERERAQALERNLQLESCLMSLTAALTSLQNSGLLRRMRKRIRDWRHAKLIRNSPQFDADWYIRRYPDVSAHGFDPAYDFLWNAALLERDPGPGFDSSWYLRQYPDVSQTAINPLVHYILFGAAEGRRIRPVEVPPSHTDEVRRPHSRSFGAGWP